MSERRWILVQAVGCLPLAAISAATGAILTDSLYPALAVSVPLAVVLALAWDALCNRLSRDAK